MGKQYVAIDLKSFFASVECVKRKLDPLKTNLVVADETRTEKTVCLAVTPSLKAYGIGGRARLFEVIQKVEEINARRKAMINGRPFRGSSSDADELAQNPFLKLDFIIAPPCMSDYIKRSTQIYSIYLKYIAPEDILVYSIDEVFIDVTSYLNTYKTTPRELAMKMVKDVLSQTGITATAGIGTNLYLSKIAMDVFAKRIPADENGVRIAELDEMTYRQQMWDHKPITDFWRVGRGTAKRLATRGLYTMGDIARLSIDNEDILYSMFGVNAELLIDHAWGWEPVEIADIKAYKPEHSSLSSGQVLPTAYDYEKAHTCIVEMADLTSLDLVAKNLVTNQIVITVCYDVENLSIPEIADKYNGEITLDFYSRRVPKPSHGTINLNAHTSSAKVLMENTSKLFRQIANPDLLVRRLYINVNNVVTPEEAAKIPVQLDLFESQSELDTKQMEKEHSIQNAALEIKKKYGKNAILKGMNFQEGATTRTRNGQIGGHKA